MNNYITINFNSIYISNNIKSHESSLDFYKSDLTWSDIEFYTDLGKFYTDLQTLEIFQV